jgi:GH15 family glucan-1,4-alpha-glucosidase
MDQDLAVVYDVEHNLFRGTPPNTYQIEGVYPEWMELSDITETYSLSVNALYYEALKSLSKMAHSLQNGKHARYQLLSDKLKKSINSNFWMEHRHYYSSMLYNDAKVQDERSNTLANAWTILFDLADEARGQEIARYLPVTSLGAPRYYPFQKQLISPANNSIWIIHQATWNKAIKKVKNWKLGTKIVLVELLRLLLDNLE